MRRSAPVLLLSSPVAGGMGSRGRAVGVSSCIPKQADVFSNVTLPPQHTPSQLRDAPLFELEASSGWLGELDSMLEVGENHPPADSPHQRSGGIFPKRLVSDPIT